MLGLLYLDHAVLAHLGTGLFLALPLAFLFFVGNLWACVGALGALWYRAAPQLYRFSLAAVAAFLAVAAIAAMFFFSGG